MFGYVKPVHSELLVKEYEFYKAAYCGVCRAMKRHTGRLSNISLSYDSVLLALVRMLYVPDEKINAKMQKCIAHPFKKRCMLVENEAIEYTARAFAILAYYKVMDDFSDEGGGKRALLAPIKPILASGARRAELSDISSVIKEKLDEINLLEREGKASVDEPANLFGELLSEVFSFGMEGDDKTVLSEFGLYLGRFIYAADAAEDYEEDRARGRYNPYVLLYEGKPLTKENKMSIKCALILECKNMETAVNLMPFGNRYTIENIVKNIIYLGLIKRIEFLDKDDNAPREKKSSSKENENER